MKNIEGHLLIIGNGELFSELNELIIKYKIQSKVTIKKSVPNDQIQKYYKSAKIFTLAYNTKVESLPIPVMESMAAGCEVVSTNLGALYETCAPFGTLVGFDSNFNNLEKKYSKVLENSIKNYWSDENQHKLKLQRETINLTYSWEARANEWKTFLDEARRMKN